MVFENFKMFQASHDANQMIVKALLNTFSVKVPNSSNFIELFHSEFMKALINDQIKLKSTEELQFFSESIANYVQAGVSSVHFFLVL